MKNLSSSLINFHANFKPIIKDAQNPFFKSDYLTLSGILDAVRPQLSSQGLAIVQSMKVIESSTVLITSIIHVSGESISSEMTMPVLNDPQKMGSLITYYKRYQLQAILAISTVDEDDDANRASGKDVGYKPTPVKSPTPKPTFIVEPTAEQKPVQIKNPMDKASDAQKGALTKMGIYFSNDITKSEASALIEKANMERKSSR